MPTCGAASSATDAARASSSRPTPSRSSPACGTRMTLGTPLTLVVRNLDHKNWTWGMSPWEPEGEPQGKGTKPVTLPRPGHADLAGVLKYGHDDVRNALERASARHTATHVAAGVGRQGAARDDRHHRHGQAARGRWRARRRRHARGDGRGPQGSRHARRHRRGRGRGLPAGPRLVRGEVRPARRAARLRADGDPGRQGRRGGRRLRARTRARVARRTTRSTPGSSGARTTPAGSRRESRTGSRSSCARR